MHHPGTTFLQRAANVELARLEIADVAESYDDVFTHEGISVCDGASRKMAEASEGYAFMVQLVGFYTWKAAARSGANTIGLEHVAIGIEEARRSFASTVLKPILSRVSQGQTDYLRAMAQCGEGDVQSGEVAKRMGMSTAQLGTFRARLIEAGILEATGYGKARIAIPYLREYLNHLE